MNVDLIEHAKALLEGATPGPWYCFTDDSAGKDSLHLMSEYDDGSWVEGKQGPFPLDPFTYDPTPMERATAHFIAAAPRLVTELVAEVERLRTALDQRTDPDHHRLLLILLDRLGGKVKINDSEIVTVDGRRRIRSYTTDSDPYSVTVEAEAADVAARLLGGDR